MTPQLFRARFPSLGRRVHLASCSLGARSRDLDETMAAMLDDMADGGAPWPTFEERIAEARERFAAYVGARPDQIAIMPDASTGAYQVASTMDYSRRPRIVSSTVEFPSLAQVWLAQRPRGAEVVRVDDATAALPGPIDERTRLVSVPLFSYQDAGRRPVEELTRAAHAAGAQVLVDAYQAGSAGPVDVTELDCDFLVMGTMKYLLGLPGIAFLYVRDPAAIDRMPRLTGWFGRVNPFAFDATTLDFAAGADRFRVGTASVPAAYAACAGLRLIGGLDPVAVREHVHDLADLAAARLTEQGEQVVVAPRERRGAHIGLSDPDPHRLGTALAEHGIAVSPRGPVVRISLHYYNNDDDVAALCAALSGIRGSKTRTVGWPANKEILCAPTS